ncbi:class I SAM-dependent methyltransferase [Pollutimonas sp. M17]|uniref:class I SAM-dependent methyltransferase n=1 Tax=Pollutimonas sp. M17 TaxID=2962065 RepID=UPI0021F4AC85|nr:class I SAM-dependent methyltransferase [Pollutimonas sp. M17]UYO93967.1 class I SAM-dependent methyltransferase [Pollutimonas sp. M17]
MNNRVVQRQARRYEPYPDDPYWELNQALTAHLNRYGEQLRGSKVLDFGCGERPFEFYFSRFGAQAVACDLQQNRFGTVDVVLDRKAPKLPFEAGTFDAICLFDVLEHIEDDLALLGELHRILKNDGLLLLSVPFMYRFHEIPHDYRRYTPTGLQFVLTRSGFDVEEIQPMGSAIFVADTLLRETTSKFLLGGASFARRLAMKIFLRLRDPEDPCSVSPFAFFAAARQKTQVRYVESGDR